MFQCGKKNINHNRHNREHRNKIKNAMSIMFLCGKKNTNHNRHNRDIEIKLKNYVYYVSMW